MRIKKIDVFVARTFLGPFVATFFIVLFILVMQFLWKYVDDLIGKGLEWFIVGKLLFFASSSFVPIAIPLAVLLSSLMTFGSMGEYYELTALKSSGISLFRIMRGLLVIVLLICFGSFYFSNSILPVANLKFYSLLYDIRQQKPAMNLKEGIFYNDIEGYSIRANKKDPDNKTIYDVLVYDHTSGRGNDNVLIAKKGEMTMTVDKRYLILKFYDGHQYEELASKGKKKSSYEQTRTTFKEWEKIFDLTDFKLSRTDESLFEGHYEMMNIRQLDEEIDTMKRAMLAHKKNLRNYTEPYFRFAKTKVEILKNYSSEKNIDTKPFLENFSKSEQKDLIQKTLNSVRTVKGFVSIMVKDLDIQQSNIIQYETEWHRKITLAVACMVFFFIGAPLGAIIRKGGLGLPLVVAVLFFIFQYVLSITGEKFAGERVMTSFQGMWMAIFILTPIGLFLTYKAMHDSSLMNKESYITTFKKINSFIIKIFRKGNNSAHATN